MRKRNRPDWLCLHESCIPCAHGQHAACRHRPNDGKGGQFTKAADDAVCACEAKGHPISPVCCDARMQGWSYHLCDNPAKTTRTTSEFGTTAEVPYCGVHARGIDTRAANDAKWRAEWDERDRRRQAEREAGNASVDWADRLRDEFGIHADGHYGGEGLVVEVQPEHLYAVLVAASGMLRDVGVDWPIVLAEVAG